MYAHTTTLQKIQTLPVTLNSSPGVQRSHLVSGGGDESVLDVDPHVFAEQAGPQEALGADAAAVRFVGHVGLLVSPQVGRGGEGLGAHRAVVQLLRRVDL